MPHTNNILYSQMLMLSVIIRIRTLHRIMKRELQFFFFWLGHINFSSPSVKLMKLDMWCLQINGSMTLTAPGHNIIDLKGWFR